MPILEATVIIQNCPKVNKNFAVRVEKTSHDNWQRTWSFKIDDAKIQKEHYLETKVTGSLEPTSDYPGCPHCETKEFILCGRCSKLSCYHGQEKFTCNWCGNHSNVRQTTEKLEISGNNF